MFSLNASLTHIHSCTIIIITIHLYVRHHTANHLTHFIFFISYSNIFIIHYLCKAHFPLGLPFLSIISQSQQSHVNILVFTYKYFSLDVNRLILLVNSNSFFCNHYILCIYYHTTVLLPYQDEVRFICTKYR